MHPTLLDSCSQIYVHCVAMATKREELLENFKRSTRGSIRKPPNVMTWVLGLQQLRANGDSDIATIVKHHNANSSKAGQLAGAKAQAVKNLLEQLPNMALNVLSEHVQSLGWDNCAFSDDCLSSKKYLPGHQFRRGIGLWIARGKVTKESCELTLRHIIAVHESTSPAMRKKVDRATIEEKAEEATLAWHMGLALKQAIPVDEEVLKRDWLDMYVVGNAQVMLEIQMALQAASVHILAQSSTGNQSAPAFSTVDHSAARQ